MSTEQATGESSQKTATQSQNTTETSTSQTPGSKREEGPRHETADVDERKPAATSGKSESKSSEPVSKSETTTTSPETPDDPRTRPRQVIAVSASKGPAAFFNLARKFLVTDEMCDLSALEGAIVSAADAAHLLERSKLATIVRVETSYVTVEPKRRRQAAPQPGTPAAAAAAATAPQQHPPPPPQPQSPVATAATQPFDSSQTSRGARGSANRELRRARIVITVKRTEMYKQWLEDNPLQAVIAGDQDEEEEGDDAAAIDVGAPRQDR